MHTSKYVSGSSTITAARTEWSIVPYDRRTLIKGQDAKSDMWQSQVLLNCCRCVEIDVWDGEPKSKLAEAEHKSGDEKKHKFGSRFARNISSHGPFKHFHKEKSPSKSTTSEEGDPLSMPTPWTSASTALRAEPRVLHGYTLTKEVPFRDVCVAIRDAAFVNRYAGFHMLLKTCVDVPSLVIFQSS